MRTAMSSVLRAWAALAAAGLLSCSCAGMAAEPPTLDTISAAMRYQDTATVEVRFTTDFINIPASPAVRVGEPADRLAAQSAPEASGVAPRTSSLITYIRTPQMLYCKRDATVESSERTGASGILDHLTKTRNSDDTCRGSISVTSPVRRWTVIDRIETALYPMYARADDPSTAFLQGWIKYGKVSPQMESIDGHDCWKIEVTDTSKCIVKRYEMWLDPSVGLNPRRLTMYGNDGQNGEWSVVVDSKDYRQIADGIWFPAEQTMVKNVPKQGVVDHRLVFKAQSLSGSKTYSKEDLRVTFDPGTKIDVQGPDGTVTTVVQQ